MYDNVYKGYTFIYLFQHDNTVMNNAKGQYILWEKEVLSPSVINPVKAVHYSQTYDGLKCISGEMLCASLELFSLFMAKDEISQPFKLYTASLKQGLFSSRKYVS